MRNWASGMDVVCIATPSNLKHNVCLGKAAYPIKDCVYNISGFTEAPWSDRSAIYLVLAGLEGACTACNRLLGWHESCFKPMEKILPESLTSILVNVPKTKIKEVETVE